eukprot:2144701-Prymnesium_polylepis.1
MPRGEKAKKQEPRGAGGCSAGSSSAAVVQLKERRARAASRAVAMRQWGGTHAVVQTAETVLGRERPGGERRGRKSAGPQARGRRGG